MVHRRTLWDRGDALLSAAPASDEYFYQFNHTYCGTTSFAPDGLIKAFQERAARRHISALYDRGNIAIADYESSLKRDTRLLRESKGTPKHVNIYGYLFNIDTEGLMLIVEDRVTPL